MCSASRARKPGGKPCPIPSMSTSSAPGIASAVARPTYIHHAIREAVDHQSGHLELPQSLRAIARCDRGDGLASDGDHVMASVEGPGGGRCHFIHIAWIPRRADGAQGVYAMLNHLLAGHRLRTAEHFPQYLRRDLPDGCVARGRHHRDERALAVGMLDGDGLRDLAAHGCADHMRRLNAQRVHESNRVGGHIRQPVGC